MELWVFIVVQSCGSCGRNVLFMWQPFIDGNNSIITGKISISQYKDSKCVPQRRRPWCVHRWGHNNFWARMTVPLLSILLTETDVRCIEAEIGQTPDFYCWAAMNSGYETNCAWIVTPRKSRPWIAFLAWMDAFTSENCTKAYRKCHSQLRKWPRRHLRVVLAFFLANLWNLRACGRFSMILNKRRIYPNPKLRVQFRHHTIAVNTRTVSCLNLAQSRQAYIQEQSARAFACWEMAMDGTWESGTSKWRV